MSVSDWLPTYASLAGIPAAALGNIATGPRPLDGLHLNFQITYHTYLVLHLFTLPVLTCGAQYAWTGFDFTSVFLSTTGSRNITTVSALSEAAEQSIIQPAATDLPRKEIVHKPLNQVQGNSMSRFVEFDLTTWIFA
eukprot:COSAG02_NODE_482_length_21409_cov_126.131018_26_plen_137_part_00